MTKDAAQDRIGPNDAGGDSQGAALGLSAAIPIEESECVTVSK